MAAVLGMTLSAGVQAGGGGSGEVDVAQGRVVVRVEDRTDDGVDDYRIEFGFLPEWAMDAEDPWAEAITTWPEWLPRSRYLAKAVIDRRAADDNRRWLRSSLISVPASASGAALITGRVIVRYNPDSRGRLRIEFGFLPEWAFAGTANTEEAVERYGDGLLPRSRYLSASVISSRRGVWLRSSVIEVPFPPLPPVIDSIGCSPSSPRVGDSVTCWASLSGGAPDSYFWSGGDSSGSSATYRTSFDTWGRKTVRLTVRNSAGSDSDSITLTVSHGGHGPIITCSPSTTTVNASVTCTASLSGGTPTSYSWSGGDSSGSSATYRTSFSSYGRQTVTLTVRDAEGSYSESQPVDVVASIPPSKVARCGSDSAKIYWFDDRTTNYRKHWLNVTWEVVAMTTFNEAWRDPIGHMSQSACDSWPNGRDLTAADFGR